jgi:hypothetical protein
MTRPRAMRWIGCIARRRKIKNTYKMVNSKTYYKWRLEGNFWEIILKWKLNKEGSSRNSPLSLNPNVY